MRPARPGSAPSGRRDLPAGPRLERRPERSALSDRGRSPAEPGRVAARVERPGYRAAPPGRRHRAVRPVAPAEVRRGDLARQRRGRAAAYQFGFEAVSDAARGIEVIPGNFELSVVGRDCLCHANTGLAGRRFLQKLKLPQQHGNLRELDISRDHRNDTLLVGQRGAEFKEGPRTFDTLGTESAQEFC